MMAMTMLDRIQPVADACQVATAHLANTGIGDLDLFLVNKTARDTCAEELRAPHCDKRHVACVLAANGFNACCFADYDEDTFTPADLALDPVTWAPLLDPTPGQVAVFVALTRDGDRDAAYVFTNQ